jgi:hypothetical protein
LEKAEIFNDGVIRVGMKVNPDIGGSEDLSTIAAEIMIANMSTKKVKISSLTMEGISMLVDTEEEYKVILSPNHSHRIAFEENCKKLHLAPSTIKIEYVREEDDLELFSKATFILPLVPVIKMNTPITGLPNRVHTLWESLTYSWQEVITLRFNPDQSYFPDSKEIATLLPNMCESVETLEKSQLPAEEVEYILQRLNIALTV